MWWDIISICILAHPKHFRHFETIPSDHTLWLWGGEGDKVEYSVVNARLGFVRGKNESRAALMFSTWCAPVNTGSKRESVVDHMFSCSSSTQAIYCHGLLCPDWHGQDQFSPGSVEKHTEVYKWSQQLPSATPCQWVWWAEFIPWETWNSFLKIHFSGFIIYSVNLSL